MGINLAKGQRVEVKPTDLTIGLGWNPAAGTSGPVDLDCSIFLLNDQKMLPTDKHFVFYNNIKSPCGSIIHSGDDTTGESSNGGDDEQISINLDTLDVNVVEMLIVASIHTGQNFGSVADSYIRIVDNSDNTEIAKYTLDESFSIEKSVEFGRLYKINGEWKFAAVGVGYDEDLSFFVEKHYSGNVVK